MSESLTLDAHFVPFTIRGLFFHTQGLLRLEPQTIVVEFQYVNRWFKALRTDVHVVQIPFVSFHRSGLSQHWHRGTDLHLQSNSLLPFRRIPRAQHGIASFHIPQAHREQGEQFAQHLRLRLSEYHLGLNPQEFELNELAQRILNLQETEIAEPNTIQI